MKVVISDKCIACGICYNSTELLFEQKDGKAGVKGNNILTEEQIKELKKVAEECPENAISIEEVSIVKSTGKEGLKELKELIQKNVMNFKIVYPPKEEFAFDRNQYSLPSISSSKEGEYDYKSEYAAESAGKKEFNRLCYSQIYNMAKYLLNAFSTRKTEKYSKYEQDESNFAFQLEKQANNMLSEIGEELQRLGNCNIKPELTKVDMEEYHRVSPKKSMFVNLHDYPCRFMGDIQGEIASLASNYDYIETDDAGRYYCFYIQDNIDEFLTDLMDAADYVINDSDAYEFLCSCFDKEYGDFIKAVHNRGEQLCYEIDKLLMN